MSDSFPPSLADRFQLIRALESGPDGGAYLIRDVAQNRAQLLRTHLGLTPEATADCRSRAETLVSLRHPSLVPLEDHGPLSEGGYFLVFGEAGDESLTTRLQRRPPPGRVELVGWGRQAAEGLAAIHRAGFLHGRLSPAEIRLRGAEAALLPSVLLPPSREEVGPGSAVYVAPEVWAGEAASPASDQFSLAASLYATRYRQPVYPAYTPAEIQQLVADGFTVEALGSPATMKAGLERALAVAMLREPGERHSNLEEFCDELIQDRGEEPVTNPGDRPVRASAKGRTTSQIVLPRAAQAQRRTRRLYLWVIGISMMICVAMAAMLSFRGAPP